MPGVSGLGRSGADRSDEDVSCEVLTGGSGFVPSGGSLIPGGGTQQKPALTVHGVLRPVSDRV